MCAGITHDGAARKRERQGRHTVVLDDEQCSRFFDTMDALLYYVNERFQVVENFTLDYEGQLGDMKTALVARELWENVEVIDEFVRENPARLPQRCLDAALAWKSALPGLYTVVRYQSGRALLMNEAGVFAVGGVTLELEGEIGKAPAYVDMVLLPFEGQIVYDGFLQAYDGDGTVEEETRIQDEFENRCSSGIVSTAEKFSQVADAFLQARRDEELDALLDDVVREADGGAEQLPPGFHRGPLAGLDTLEREAALAVEQARRPDASSAPGATAAPTAPGIPAAADTPAPPPLQSPHTWADIQADQAMNCAIACTLSRGLVSIEDAYAQYQALVPNPIGATDFEALVRSEASFADAYFGIWSFQGCDYLAYYTLTPDYIAQMASHGNGWRSLREELDYYESYRQGLLESRAEVPPRPLSRTLLENTPLGELLRDESVTRLRKFLDERIPDGQDDYTFADLAAQEFALTAIEAGNLEELYRLSEDLGLTNCSADETRLPRLATNVFNAMPSWENNGWSPQELYEQLTGRRVFYNDDGTVKHVGADDPCPCGSGQKYRECHGR